MKKINARLSLILFLLMIVINACEKTEPEVPTADRDKFIGTYAAESTGPGGQRNFTLTISASASAPDQIKMAEFDGGINTTVFANVSGNSLSIFNQIVSGETYQGSGNLSGKNLTVNFTVYDGQTTESRVLTGTKQQ